MVVCYHCESIIPPHYEYCPVCGHPLKESYKIKLKDSITEREDIESAGATVVFEEFRFPEEME